MFTRREQIQGFQHIDPAIVIRGWVNFSPVPSTILGQHNVTSVSRSSGGQYTVTWAGNLVASAYAQVVALTSTDSAGSVLHPSYNETASSEPLTASSTLVNMMINAADTSPVDTQLLTVIMMGPR